MKRGISPIVTLNTSPLQNGGDGGDGGDNVSDIFNDLVVPNWALYNPSKLMGGSSIIRPQNDDNNSDSDCDSDDALDDTLHDKLLEMVKHQEAANNFKKKNTKKARAFPKNKITKKKLNKVK